MNAVFRTLDALIIYFDSRIKERDPKAVGLYKKMTNKEFMFIIYMMMDVLPIVSKLCLVFQKQDLDVAYAKVALDQCMADLEKYKAGENIPFPTHLEHFDDHVKADEEGKLTFKGHKITDTKANLQNLKSKFLNQLLSNLKSRFPNMSLLTSFHVLGMRPLSMVQDLDDWGNEDIEKIFEYYGNTQVYSISQSLSQ